MSKKGYVNQIFSGQAANGAGDEIDVSNVDEISLLVTADGDADFTLAFLGHNIPGATVNWANAGSISNKIAPVAVIPQDSPSTFLTTLAISAAHAKLYKVNVEGLSKFNILMSGYSDGLCDVDVYATRDVN